MASKKPKGARNLFRRARGGQIYYQARIPGQRRRVVFSTGTADWDSAMRVRDEFEARKGIGRVAVPVLESPTFAAMADRYLAEGTGHLATTTRADRHRLLNPKGLVTVYWGARPIDEITRANLLAWWAAEVEANPNRTRKTGLNHLDAIGAVLRHASELDLLDTDAAVRDCRAVLRARRRTKSGRAEAESKAAPLTLAGLAAVACEAEVEDPWPFAYVLLMADAGLRDSEAIGLRWGDIDWQDRQLRICQSRPRGGAPEPPKSGRPRTVQASARLLAALRRWRLACGRPKDAIEVLAPTTLGQRRSAWARICKRAKVKARRHDLRHTFASHLLTAGVQLAYVSRQLGHRNVQITADVYARWVGGDTYRQTPALAPGEVPADLLARGASEYTVSTPTPPQAAASAPTGRQEPQA